MRLKLALSLLLLFLFSFLHFPVVYASHCSSVDYDCQISEIQREMDALAPAHENNKNELTSVNKQIIDLKNRVAALSNQLKKVESEIGVRQEELAFAQAVFEEKTAHHYKVIRTYDPLLPFLSAENAVDVFRKIVFRQRAVDGDRETMDKYGQDLLKLKTDKENLEKNKVSLAAAQANLDNRSKFLASEVSKVENYLATLDAKQEELAALKAGGFATSVGETPATAEPCSGSPGTSTFCDPGFRPAFAAFSFGAPHRTGMSQYGAYGRSKSGQNAETILSAYYQGAQLRKDYPVPATIGVSGHGRVAFEENYLLGIYEVPESWGSNGGFEALKAQAVAARSYALAVTNNGAGTICPTESCQVYKPQLKSGKWAEAVRATRGWVVIKDGNPAKTYFSASTGGYTISQWGWSGIKDASGDWPATAYEKVSASPWFYKAWYKDRSGKSCGRQSPWLTGEDMADILNAWKVVYQGGGDVSRITPPDTCWGGNPYSKSDLQGIGGFTSVSSVSVVYSNSGSTQSVSFSTNKGSVSMSGEELKKAFNLRAPGYVGIKSSLFNIEKL
jgi:peptidoglycan hydrolase CwlO-like protein